MDLKRSRTNTIALILTDLSGPYYSELIRSVQDVALANGYDLIACSSMGGRDSTAVRFCVRRGWMGPLYWLTTSMMTFWLNLPDHASRLLSWIVSCPVIIWSMCWLMVSRGYLATRRLIRGGHRNIAYIRVHPTPTIMHCVTKDSCERCERLGLKRSQSGV